MPHDDLIADETQRLLRELNPRKHDSHDIIRTALERAFAAGMERQRSERIHSETLRATRANRREIEELTEAVAVTEDRLSNFERWAELIGYKVEPHAAADHVMGRDGGDEEAA